MRTIAAVLLSTLMVTPAFSDSRAQLPTVDPAGQYRLIGPAERSDSRCIGRPDTPLCAVETLLACFARREPELCRVVWATGEGAASTLSLLANSRYWWSYRVAAVEQTASGETVIAVAGRNCGLQRGEPDCATTPAPPTRYRLRQVDGRWQVLDWQSQPGEPAQPILR